MLFRSDDNGDGDEDFDHDNHNDDDDVEVADNAVLSRDHDCNIAPLSRIVEKPRVSRHDAEARDGPRER